MVTCLQLVIGRGLLGGLATTVPSHTGLDKSLTGFRVCVDSTPRFASLFVRFYDAALARIMSQSVRVCYRELV
jgi:hypothetical protein